MFSTSLNNTSYYCNVKDKLHKFVLANFENDNERRSWLYKV